MPLFVSVVAGRRAARLAILRLFPLLAAVSLWRLERTSTLSLSVMSIPDPVMTAALYAYAALLAAVAVSPYPMAKAQPVGAALAVLVIGGRLMAFVGLYLGGRPDLEGSVWERLWILVAMLIWHWSIAIYETAQRRGGG